MTWILEEPIYILILGVLTLTFLGFAYTQTGYRTLMHAMLAVVALTGGLLLLENMVETNTEQVEATLETIARDVETNDLERILSHVYSEATDTYDLAQREFPQYHFDRVNIKNNVEVMFDNDRAAPAGQGHLQCDRGCPAQGDRGRLSRAPVCPRHAGQRERPVARRGIHARRSAELHVTALQQMTCSDPLNCRPENHEHGTWNRNQAEPPPVRGGGVTPGAGDTSPARIGAIGSVRGIPRILASRPTGLLHRSPGRRGRVR